MDEQHVSSNAAAVDDDQPAPRPIPGWLQECSANPRRILEFCERHDLSCSLEDAIKLVRAHFNPAKLDVETETDLETGDIHVVMTPHLPNGPRDQLLSSYFAYTEELVI